MLEITSPDIFNEVVERAKRATAGDAAWIAAIERAVSEMVERPSQFHWMGTYMLIQSPTSDEIYTSNGQCQCAAFEHHRPCKHRCAARLWQRYLEAIMPCELSERKAA